MNGMVATLTATQNEKRITAELMLQVMVNGKHLIRLSTTNSSITVTTITDVKIQTSSIGL